MVQTIDSKTIESLLFLKTFEIQYKNKSLNNTSKMYQYEHFQKRTKHVKYKKTTTQQVEVQKNKNRILDG